MEKVSVIVPIYGVEKYIERCVVSLMKQTLHEVEYIFVDDCTKDRSISVLESTISKYPDRMNRIKILHHDVNKGLPAARNTGLAVAEGEYIYHCDSDDFMEPDMLEAMYNAAKKNDADFVWSDFFLSYENSERYMKQPNFTSARGTLEGLLSDAMKYNVWNKLVKRELYVNNDIRFPSGHSMGEDMTMICLAACAKNVAYVDKAFYHYVKTNAEAMTQTFKEKHLVDIKYNVDRVVNFLSERKSDDLKKYISFFKLSVKLPFLITYDWNNYRRWYDWYPEANCYIMQNKQLALRTRVLQWMASKKIYSGVWLYIVVYRWIYNLVYRK